MWVFLSSLLNVPDSLFCVGVDSSHVTLAITREVVASNTILIRRFNTAFRLFVSGQSDSFYNGIVVVLESNVADGTVMQLFTRS